ncbi:MAG: NHL repeat-containing protein [Planctomycetota bacterium]
MIAPTLLLLASLIATPQDSAEGPSHLGQPLRTQGDLARPTAVAYGPNGALYTVDPDSRRLCGFDEAGELVLSLGMASTVGAAGLHVDAEGRIYVADAWNRAITCLNNEGRALYVIPPGALQRPGGLATHGDELFVADEDAGLVVVFGPDGKQRRVLGAGVLDSPRDVAFDAGGRLGVVDSGLAAVCVFDAEGELVRRFGEWGWFAGLLADPSGIDSDGTRWYVADRENQRVQCFDAEGKALYRTGTHAILPREGGGRLHYPSAVALRADGQRLALAEPMDQRIQIFGPAPGAKPAPDPTRPEAMQPAPHYGPSWSMAGGYLAIPEPESHSVRIYDLRLTPGDDPVRVCELGGFGRDPGLLRDPAGLCLVAGDPLELWIADRGNRRIAWYRLDLSQAAPLAQDFRAPKLVGEFDLVEWFATCPDRMGLTYVPRPVDVQRTEAGETLVLCRANRAVLRFDAKWQLVGVWRGENPAWIEPVAIAWQAPRLAVSDLALGRVHLHDTAAGAQTLLGEGELRRPMGLEFTAAGDLAVVDRYQSELFVLKPDGSVTRHFAPGLGREELYGPSDVAVATDGAWWVLDHGNHRAMVWGADWAWRQAFGSKLYTRPARKPEGEGAKGAPESE